MGLSKSARISILLAIDSAFFILELVTGYAVHSLALVADSFHMLNDVLSLCVGLWAVKMANRSFDQTPKMYTYGYQRAETLGALVNGVFLVALCVTIFLDAIQRFVEPQEVSQPQLVLIVGCLGLASNLFGLVLFHEHSHGGHSHGGHGHDGHDHKQHGNEVRDAEEGHAHHGHSHAQDIEHSQSHDASTNPESETTAVDEESTPRGKRRHSRSASRGLDYDGPKSFRHSIMIAADQLGPVDDEEDEDEDTIAPAHTHDHAHEHEHEHGNHTSSPLLAGHPKHNGYGAVNQKHDHQQHKHAQPKQAGSGSGHSHGDLNMRGIFLHVMGDALGNLGVIATALVIWLTKYTWRFYFDPAISLIITIIILCSAIPLCQAAARILLQAVPHGIEVDDIKADIEDLDGIESCHHLHVWQLSDTKLIASLHVKVDFSFKGATGSARYMELAKAVRECLHEYGIHSSTIQPEFANMDDSVNGGVADGSALVGSRTQSEVGSASCLLECGEACEVGSCCPPQA